MLDDVFIKLEVNQYHFNEFNNRIITDENFIKFEYNDEIIVNYKLNNNFIYFILADKRLNKIIDFFKNNYKYDYKNYGIKNKNLVYSPYKPHNSYKEDSDRFYKRKFQDYNIEKLNNLGKWRYFNEITNAFNNLAVKFDSNDINYLYFYKYNQDNTRDLFRIFINNTKISNIGENNFGQLGLNDFNIRNTYSYPIVNYNKDFKLNNVYLGNNFTYLLYNKITNISRLPIYNIGLKFHDVDSFLLQLKKWNTLNCTIYEDFVDYQLNKFQKLPSFVISFIDSNEFIEILYPYQNDSLTDVKRKRMSLYKQKINNKKINKLWKEDNFWNNTIDIADSFNFKVYNKYNKLRNPNDENIKWEITDTIEVYHKNELYLKFENYDIPVDIFEDNFIGKNDIKIYYKNNEYLYDEFIKKYSSNGKLSPFYLDKIFIHLYINQSEYFFKK